jgi:quinol monooxygenase YgiN
MTFSLLVSLTFKSNSDKEIFLEEIKSFAEWIKKNESTTTAYKVLESDKDELEILVLERYVDKDAYLEVHKKSSAFLAFRSKLQSLNPIISGKSYYDIDIGFV